jgi:hypothetical protein
MSLIERAKEIKNQVINNELHDFAGNGLYYKYASNNTILFTVEFYALLHDLDLFDFADAKRLNSAIYWLQRRR